MTQAEALSILKSGRNVFLTGEPGAGKSYTVNAYVAYLRSHGIDVAVTASTGIAATHIGGMTIHSWSGIGIASSLSEHDLREMAGRDKLAKRIKATKVLIIDEISMLDGRMLTCVERVCRAVRGSMMPFGGIQVVFVGDFFQLPPVSRENDVLFAFDSHAWKDAAPTICYLHEQHRQEDAEFLSILAAIRTGEVTDGHRETLASRQSSMMEEITKLFSHNTDVDRINTAELRKLPGTSATFIAKHRGAKPLVETLFRGCLSPERLELKIGAKVMFTKNDPEKSVVNGTTGTVTMFQRGSNFPIVQLVSGRVVVAEPMDWSMVADGAPLATISQIPLRLAWAMTVHKSQGMSLDAAYVDLSSAFAFGQGYVALSRVRTLSGLHLGGINERALMVDPVVLERDQQFREASATAVVDLTEMTAEQIEANEQKFILECGGKLEASEFLAGAKGPGPKHSGSSQEPKATRWEKTFQIVAGGKTVQEAADQKSVSPDTILKHLEGLHKEKPLNIERIRHIFPGDGRALAEIHIAIAVLGFEKMKPVYERLKGKYDYETLRIAHLLYREM